MKTLEHAENEPTLPSWLDSVLDDLAERVARRLASRQPQPAIEHAREHEEGVSVKEAARMLGVSERSVHRAVGDRSIPSMKVRGRRVVLVDKYVAANSDEAVARRAREVLRSA